jgi:hypothetical protein
MRELTCRVPGTYRQWAQVYPQAAERAPARGSRGTLAPQICGVQYSIANRFLIDRQKRLEMAATHRKQSSRVISNRYKKRGSCEARLAEFQEAPTGAGCAECASGQRSRKAIWKSGRMEKELL